LASVLPFFSSHASFLSTIRLIDDSLFFRLNGRGAKLLFFGRPLTRVEGVGLRDGMTSTWTWDTRPYGKGLLATAGTDNGYSRTESYDSLSRPPLDLRAPYYSGKAARQPGAKIESLIDPD
jgi:hypothetical protein